MRDCGPVLPGDDVAASDASDRELTETLTVEGRERSDAIAGFYRLRDGRIESAKIYREGSADVA
ncbi:hypothetical protein GCM10023317_90170 [Actinopolymorpha pittospori]|uniref:SnoaL-like domain-containing protein n=1 Tax=Actinopolymorpha pittospori TaxID=648752 RepID=A0A927N0C4_9ACTN|nr:hypothetical protein [Actinopolymorpha pittospori]